MTLETEGTVTRNRQSAQVYFEQAFARDSQFPLEIGDSYFARVVGPAVVLLPDNPGGEIDLDLPEGYHE